jgi:nucleoside-diphosphate-sugar epimerase
MTRTRILVTGADSLIGSHILGLLLSGHNLSIQAIVRTREWAFTLQEQFTQRISSALEFRVSYKDDIVLPGHFDDALNVPNDPFQIVLHILTAVSSEEADCLARFVNVESDAVSGFLDSVQRLAKQAHRVVLISSLAQFARWLQKEQSVHSINQEYALATCQAGDNIIYDAVLKWISESRPHFDVVYITAPSLYGPATRPLETSSDVMEANRRIWDLCSNEYRERVDMPPYGIVNFVDVRVSQLLPPLRTR